MSYTREQWATDFLHSIGNNAPSQQTIDWVVWWGAIETAPFEAPNGGAQYDLLNTTQPEPGSTWFNTFGSAGQYHVMNYPTYTEGVQTNAKELANGYYPALLQALQTNDTAALGYATGAPSSAIASELGTWGTGSGWVSGAIASPGQWNGQVFSGTPGAVSPQTSGSGSSGSSTATAQPCPYQNVPIFGTIYCAGWNSFNAASALTSAAGGNPIAALIQFGQAIFKSLLIFLLGLVLVVVGFWLLMQQVGSGETAVVDKLLDKVEGSPKPAPAPAQPATNVAPSELKNARSKPPKRSRVQQVKEAATVAAKAAA